MSGLWHISAYLEIFGDKRIVNYRVNRVSKYAYPTLGTILFWCKDACEKLLSDLQEKEAGEKDIEYVKKEIAFLSENQISWKNRRGKW